MEDQPALIDHAPRQRPRRSGRANSQKPPKSAGGRQKHDKHLDRAAAFYANITPPATARESRFRHGFWETKREKVIAAMNAVNTNVFKLERFQQCGSEAQVCWSETKQKYRIRANYCHDRHCEPCMRSKANRIAANLTTRLDMKARGRYRLITLTLKHSAAPLVDQVKRLYACFRKLRNSRCWKNTQVGGAFSLEVKLAREVPAAPESLDRSDSTIAPTTRPEWHPHLHITSEGSWINAQELADTWHKITGDSFIVDVRAIDKGRDAANYVAKYVTKGTSSAVWNDIDTAAEWMIAVKGVRTCGTFGTWRGWRLTQAIDTADDWKPICRLDALIDRAAGGEVHAQQLILILRPPFMQDAAGEGR